MTKRRVWLIAVITAFCATAADDPFVGEWKLNKSKSKYNIGHPEIKAQTITFSSTGKITVETIQGDDTTFRVNFTPVEGKKIDVDDSLSMIQKHVDAYTIEQKFFRSGEVVFKGTMVIAKDGKTLVATTEEDDKTDVELFEKQ